MKSLVKKHATEGIWIEDVDQPEIRPNEVLIQVRRTAICGTDVHIYNWDDWAQRTVPVPMTVGHEFMGEIVQLGSQVEGYQVGDRVSAEG
ncbi:MAG: alcohol dehydrogenase catalytic domain-containing protein, partial [Pseudomonadota bacterium]